MNDSRLFFYVCNTMKQMLPARDRLQDASTVDGYDDALTQLRKIHSPSETVAGLQPGDPRPVEIKLHQKSRILEISFDDGRSYRLSCEYLRVYSPSAEVRGHGPGQEVLQEGKKEVEINAIEPVGHYAVRLVFNDGHNTGLYSWDYLYSLGETQPRLWQQYLEKLALAGLTREPVDKAPPKSGAISGWKKV